MRAYHSHAFLEADASWYQPVRARQDDELVPQEALAIVQPFHPGVLNILYPYAPTLAKMRALKQRLQRKPNFGRFASQAGLAAGAGSEVPLLCGAWSCSWAYMVNDMLHAHGHDMEMLHAQGSSAEEPSSGTLSRTPALDAHFLKGGGAEPRGWTLMF